MAQADGLGQIFDPNYDGEHGCTDFAPCTNADRIRAMSDEELAKELGHTSLCEYIQREYGSFCENRAVCTNCIVDWLKESSYV